MNYLQGLFLVTCACVTASVSQAQDVWSALARTTFDSEALTLRVPCVALVDANGSAVDGYAPAYAINLQLTGEVLQLVDPISTYSSVPAVCLDTLVLEADGRTLNYSTTSAELDTDFIASADLYYTLTLQADLQSDNPTQFSLVEESVSKHLRPTFDGRLLDSFLISRDTIFDEVLLNTLSSNILSELFVLESGSYEVVCNFVDPLNLLEVIEVIGDNTRYRLRGDVTSAQNGQQFAADCAVWNRDLNLLETTVQSYLLVTLALP